MSKPEDSLSDYISRLDGAYQTLLRILLLEADDISAADEKKLQQHLQLERETIDMITSLTRVVHTYLEMTEPDSEMTGILKSISDARKQAELQISENIRNLEQTMSGIKEKILSVKLPKTARRVYYSGNNPTIMDIEI